MAAGDRKPGAAPPSKPAATPRCCGRCAYFRNAPREIEAAFPGLAVMSSGSASVRAQDGLCDRHGVYLSYRDICGEFKVAAG